MNKNLLAIAISAALVASPMLASAKIKVYGHAQVEIATVDDGDSSNTIVSDNARGRIGFKASEKLGNGLTAFAKYEFKTDTTDNDSKGGTSLTARESHIGLKGSFGTVELGNLKSAYKYTGGVKYDAFVATVLEARGANGMSGGKNQQFLGSNTYGHNSFIANSIGYKTPKMGGFSAWVTYSPDEDGSARGDDGDYTFGLKFKQKAFEVFVAAVNNDEEGVDADGIKFGGMYKFGNFKVMGQYEQLEVNGGGGNVDVDIYFLAGHAKFGSNVLVAQFGNTDISLSFDGEPGSFGEDGDYWTLGLIHNMSKKTRLTVGFSSHENSTVTGNDGETDTFAVGMRVLF